MVGFPAFVAISPHCWLSLHLILTTFLLIVTKKRLALFYSAFPLMDKTFLDIYMVKRDLADGLDPCGGGLGT